MSDITKTDIVVAGAVILGIVVGFIKFKQYAAQEGEDFRAGIAASIAVAGLETSVIPVAPAPEKDGSCPDCKGEGTVGDGRTMLTCQTCGGTGKLETTPGSSGVLETPIVEAEPHAEELPVMQCQGGQCRLPLRRLFGKRN